MSAVTAQWAVHAIGNDDRPNAHVALGLTGFLGLAYINVAVFLYEQMGLSVNDGEVGFLILTTSGAHIAMASAAILFASVMAFRALGDGVQRSWTARAWLRRRSTGTRWSRSTWPSGT